MLTLLEWEKRLQPYFNNRLHIIGEIPLSLTDVQDMAAGVRDLIQRRGLAEATRQLEAKFPLTFITLMSGFAAQNTEQNFWQAFADLIGANKNAIINYKWHWLDLQLLKARGLTIFDFSDAATPYVMTIRYHGGIPAYSLPDYFERMVLPAVQRPALREAPPYDALQSLLKSVYFVDSPVLNFLEYSGDLGLHFFAESCRMARQRLHITVDEEGVETFDLPPYVVAAFEAWMEKQEDSRQHWRKPYLQVAPYSEEAPVFLVLPEQEIPLEYAGRRLLWRIIWQGQADAVEIPCKVFRQRQNVVTNKEIFPIQIVCQRMTVSINFIDSDSNSAHELRYWSLPLAPHEEQPPLIAFDNNARHIPSGQPLTAEQVYLLHPKGVHLDFDGEEQLVEECPPLGGEWGRWVLKIWDLAHVWSVLLNQEDMHLDWIVPVQEAQPQPKLIEGHLFQFQEDPDQPIYTSDPPDLWVPLSPSANVQFSLGQWQVRLHSLWEAAPCLDKTIKLSTYADQIKIQDQGAAFPLTCLLGETPAGLYELEVTGPRESNARFRIRLWPKLLLIGHSLELTAPKENAEPTSFNLRLQENAACELQAGAENIEIKISTGIWQVTAQPEVSLVQLNLTTLSENQGTVRVPVSIPLPKLRWALAEEQSPGSLEWRNEPLHLSIDQFLQHGACSLHLEMYGLGAMLSLLKLQLVELGETRKVIQDAKITPTNFSADWLRVTLGQFSDSVKTINSLAQFELVFRSPQNSSKPLVIPLLELSRQLEISKVSLESAGDFCWKLTWKEPRPLKNRRVMIMSAWQPWQKLWEYKIPDNAREELLLKEIALPPVRYHLYFYVLPTWERNQDKPPQGLNPFVIDLCLPETRIIKLNRKVDTNDYQFKDLFELAVIYDDMGDYKNRDITLSKCAIHIAHLTNLDLLLSLLKWMEPIDIDQPIKSFFFNNMFKPQLVDSMLNLYPLDDPAMLEYLGYTAKVKIIPSEGAKKIVLKVNEPAVVLCCLTSLLQKKDGALPEIVATMLSEARLSIRDALDLLSSEPEWALQLLYDVPISTFVNILMTGLLHKNPDLIDGFSLVQQMDLITRVIPYLEDKDIVKQYLHLVMKSDSKCGYSLIMKFAKEEMLSEEEIVDMLAVDARTSFAVLRQAPLLEEHDIWIDRLTKVAPYAAGLIVRGSRLKTPFGVSTVDAVLDDQGRQLEQASLGDPLTTLNMHTDALESISFQINFKDLEITSGTSSHAWQCVHCGYRHPQQKIVEKHIHSEHRNEPLSLRRISLPLSIEIGDITFAEEA